MPPKKGQGRPKSKKSTPKQSPPKAPKRPQEPEPSLSDDEAGLADQQAIYEQLEAMEQECRISPGGSQPLHGSRHQRRQRDQKRFQAEVLSHLSVLHAHKQGASKPDAGAEDMAVPKDTARGELTGSVVPHPALEAPGDSMAAANIQERG